MRILITGGCGFIGQNLVRRLRNHVDTIRILDDLSTGSMGDLEDLGVEVRVGSVTDREAVQSAVAGKDVIIHLAAHTQVVESQKDPWRNFEVNVAGTVAVLSAAVHSNVNRVILASTGGSIVGRQDPPVHEGMVPQPISPYGASKSAAEAYCAAFSGSYGLSTVCLRFSNVYGPYSHRKESVIARFIKQILCGEPLVIYGDGTQTRDFLFVDDLCEAVALSLAANLSDTNVFQIGSGKETSVAEVITGLLALAGRSDYRILYRPFRAGEIRRSFSLIEKSQRVLGFRPAVDLNEGLQRTWNWFLAWSERQQK